MAQAVKEQTHQENLERKVKNLEERTKWVSKELDQTRLKLNTVCKEKERLQKEVSFYKAKLKRTENLNKHLIGEMKTQEKYIEYVEAKLEQDTRRKFNGSL